MEVILKWLRAFALFGFLVVSPVSVSAINICNSGTEIFISGYHSSIIATKDAFYSFGESIAANGSDDNLDPVELNSTNGYNYTGDLLFATDGTHDTQAFILTSTNLYVWGASGTNGGTQELSISTGIAFHSIPLPVGVTPSDVTYLTNTNGAVFLVANGGRVYSQGVLSDLLGNNSTAADANGWYTVQKSTGGDLTGVEYFRAHYNGAFAVTASDEYYTWGTVVTLGDGSAAQALTSGAVLMQAPFTGSPSQIAVTGYDNNPGLSYYVLNPADTKVYVLGGNQNGQLGIGSTTDMTSWSVVQHPNGGSDLTGIIDINADDQTDHYPTAGVIVNNYDDGSGSAYNDVFLLWGANSNSALSSAAASTQTLPIVPAGFTLGTSRATRIEMGGHTSMYYDPDYTDTLNRTGKMCYVGHKIKGSMGDGVSASSTVSTFECNDTPFVATLCAAEKPPIATDDDKLNQLKDSTVTLNIVTDDNGHGVDSDPDGTINISTVDLDPSTDAIENTLTAVGEGVWSVDTNGLVTFTPDVALVGDPTDIEYVVYDNNDNKSNKATIHITYLRSVIINNVSQNELHTGSSNFDFTITLSAPSATAVTVDYTTTAGSATAGDDYTSTTGTATIPAGSTTATVSVPVAGDTTVEGDDTFTVDLSNPVGATIAVAQGTGTILNDDAATLAINNVSQNELHTGSSNFDFTITLSAPSATAVTVDYTTTAGSATAGDDYTSTTGTATIPAGSTTATVSVPVAGDTTVEGDDTFTVDLSNPVGATIAVAQGTGTILNDDAATLAINNVSQNELHTGSSNFDFTITLSAPSATAVTVDYTTTAGSATAGDDYTSTTGTATIPAGSTTATVSVPVAGDTTVEGDDTFTVDLSNPVGATIAVAQGTGTILNDDAATLAINNVSQNELHTGSSNFDFTITLSAPSATAVTVDYTTTAGSATAGDDYTSTTGTATIPAGSTTATVSVPVAGDTTVEGDDTFTVDLSNPVGATIAVAQGTGTILNDDAAIIVTSVTSDSKTEGTNLVHTVTMSGVSATDETYIFSLTDNTTDSATDYSTATFSNGVTLSGGSITVPAGVTSFYSYYTDNR